jgi:PhzF family phenazine biosynthesis protein
LEKKFGESKQMKVTASIVNAFTAGGKNGNPAGVVLNAGTFSDEQLLKVAAKLGFSETAFVSPSKEAEYELRFFTPTNEVDLCGHATIATWSLMHQKGLCPAGNFTQQTKAGLLGLTIARDGLVYMEQKKAEFYEYILPASIAPLLGIAENKFHDRLKPQIVSTGIRDLLVPLKDKKTLAELRVDLGTIAHFSRQQNISGLHIFGLLQDGESIASCRNFAPADGIDEEAATGTSNGALLCYLQTYGELKEQATYRIEQGESMGRLSYIYGKFVQDIVWIGGEARAVNEVEIELSRSATRESNT